MKAPQLVVACLCLFLVACGAAPPKKVSIIELNVNQLQSIQSFDELDAILQKLKKDLEGKDPQLYAQEHGLIPMIENQLVNLKKATVNSALSAARTEAGVVSLPLLQSQLEKLKEYRRVPASKWQPVLALVSTEITKTKALITKHTAALKVPRLADRQRAEIYDQLYAASQDEKWENEKDKFLDGLLEQIRNAQKAGQLDPAMLDKVDLLKLQRGDDPALLDELIATDAAIYEKEYFTALADGDADQAYDIFLRMSESRDFNGIKEKLSKSVQKMGALFTALADESVEDAKNLGQSYRWYSYSRTIKQKLGLAVNIGNSERLMIKQLEDHIDKVAEANFPAPELAYLYLLDDAQGTDHAIKKRLRKTEDAVRQLALKKVSTTDFNNSALRHDYGNVMSASITQYLFKTIPNDVRIIEREQYEAILREKQLQGGSDELKAVDLIITGSVLESKVDTNEAKGKKILRVVVGKESIPNPGYIAWLEMPNNERKRVDQPSETLEVDKQENITVTITRHKKVGIFSVSYRLVDAINGKVIFPDSVTMEDEHEDDSTEGVEMGDFKLPFKLADLPSDVEILDRLAKKASEYIGKKLVEKLNNQEQRYIALADTHDANDNCEAVVENLGKALTLMQLKDLPSKEVVSRFKKEAISCDSLLSI